MIRSILVLLFLALYAVFSLIALPVLALVGKINVNARSWAAYKIVTNAFRVIKFLSGAKVTLIGKENIPKGETVLYVGNHRSYYDIVLLYTIIPGLAGFMAKKEMEKAPILNIWMKYMNCLFLNRSDIREGLKTILEGIEKMKSGISMVIFPEGTRNKSESELDMLPFKEGSFKLAEKASSPIIPVALHNTNNCLEKNFPKIRKTNVVIEFGKPIYMDKLDKDEKKFLGVYTRNLIIDMLKERQ